MNLKDCIFYHDELVEEPHSARCREEAEMTPEEREVYWRILERRSRKERNNVTTKDN